MTFEDIEDWIIGKLRTEIPHLKTVKTYAGELEREMEGLPAGFPAAFVVYEGSEFEPVDGPTHSERARFTVLLCTKGLRGQEDLRKGGSGEYGGAYRLIENALSALTNQSLGPEMERLGPAGVHLVFISGTTAIYGVNFQTSFDKNYG